MPEDFWTWLLNPVLTGGVLALVAYLLRNTLATCLTKSVEQRFEKQMETFKAEIRDREKEMDHIRLFLTSDQRERDSALQMKRYEAAEILLRARHSLSQLSMLVEYMKFLNGDQILKHSDASKIAEFIETLVKPLEVEEKIKALNLLDKTLARLYLSEKALQVFDAYESIIRHAAMMMKLYSIPARDKGDLVNLMKAIPLSKMIIELTPGSKEGFGKYGEGYAYYWATHLHDEVLRLLRHEVSGMGDMGRDTESAQRLVLESRQALINVRKTLQQKGLPDTLLKTDESVAASFAIEKATT